MKITVEEPKLVLKQGQVVLYRSLAGTNQVATVFCMADDNASVCCRVGVMGRGVPDLYLPVRLYGKGWWLRDG